LRRLLKLAIALWVARWAAGELAAYAARNWRAPGPAPIEVSPPSS
jgi:hypothetical protein